MFKGFVIFLLSVAASSSFAYVDNPKTNGKEYFASSTEQRVSAFVERLQDSQGEAKLNTYASVYFSNLRENFPLNSHGSCSYVCLSELLSFYDSYSDDWIVDEDYDADGVFEPSSVENQLLDVPGFSSESPGVVAEPYSDVARLSFSDYASYVSAHEDEYLQFRLMGLAKRLGYPSSTSSDLPYGLSLYEQTRLLSFYLQNDRGMNRSDAVPLCEENYDADAFSEWVYEKIDAGMPVILNVNTYFGPHSLIAYDRDASKDDVFVHPGWRIDNGLTLTHVSLKQLGASLRTADSAISLDVRGNHDGSSANYRSSRGPRCMSIRMVYPSNIRTSSDLYVDIAPTFEWDSLIGEWLMDGEKRRISFELRTDGRGVIYEDNLVSNRSLTLPMSIWREINYLDTGDSFVIRLKLISDSNNIERNCVERRFEKPSKTEGCQPALIKATDYAYSLESFGSEASFVTHECSNGFKFKTRSVNVGRFGDSIVLAGSGDDWNEAFIEYQFFVPVDRVDASLVCWGNLSTEGLDPNHALAVIEVFRYDEYCDPEINLLENLSRFSETSVYHLCFRRPVTRFRIRVAVDWPHTHDGCSGRVCVGELAVYETALYDNCLSPRYADMIPSGGERPYEPWKWNVGGDFQNVNNCYSYALDVPNYGDHKISPGEVSCVYYSRIFGNSDLYYRYLTRNGFYYMVRLDSLPGYKTQYGFVFNAIDTTEMIPSDAYRVALAFDYGPEDKYDIPDLDYHWYRQNPDGFWSHKPGSSDVMDYDFDGNPILNPCFCNRQAGDSKQQMERGIKGDFNYSSDVYFFSVRFNQTEVEYEEDYLDIVF